MSRIIPSCIQKYSWLLGLSSFNITDEVHELHKADFEIIRIRKIWTKSAGKKLVDLAAK